MRFMIIRKADPNTEAAVMPSDALMEAMAKYNEALINAGKMLDGMGLQPSSQGARIQFKNGKPSITDGPFAETKELIAGFTLIQAESKAEALEWVKRWPVEDGDGNVYLELRRVYEMEDFAPSEGVEHHKRNFEQLTQPKLQLNPYMHFNGNCRAAFEYYERVLGGKIEMMMTYGESPNRGEMPEALYPLVMHTRLRFGDAVLMASDAPPDRFKPNQGITNNLIVGDIEEAERIFNALADNGSIIMPFEKTFWAARFGMLVDQFGIQWMVNCELVDPS